jgi:hypothetical protein
VQKTGLPHISTHVCGGKAGDDTSSPSKLAVQLSTKPSSPLQCSILVHHNHRRPPHNTSQPTHQDVQRLQRSQEDHSYQQEKLVDGYALCRLIIPLSSTLTPTRTSRARRRRRASRCKHICQLLLLFRHRCISRRNRPLASILDTQARRRLRLRRCRENANRPRASGVSSSSSPVLDLFFPRPDLLFRTTKANDAPHARGTRICLGALQMHCQEARSCRTRNQWRESGVLCRSSPLTPQLTAARVPVECVGCDDAVPRRASCLHNRVAPPQYRRFLGLPPGRRHGA